MAKTLQFRRYNTTSLTSITGANGEIIIDSDQDTVTVHDGSTVGGVYLATQAQLNANSTIQQAVNSSQNTNTSIALAGVAAANANLIILNAINTSQNANITFAIGAYGAVNSTAIVANSTAVVANIALGVLPSMNANVALALGGYGKANAVGTIANSAIQNTATLTLNTVYANTGFGYPIGSGAIVTQATNRTTSVTLNQPTGRIVLFAQAMANSSSNTFTFNNTSISANDFILLNHWSGGTIGNYTLNANTGVGLANVTIRCQDVISTAEQPVIQYIVIKGAAS